MKRPYIEQFVSCQDSTPESLIDGAINVLEYERAKGRLSPSVKPPRLSPDGKFVYLSPFWACRDDGSSFLEPSGSESCNCLPIRLYHEALFERFNPLEIARYHVPEPAQAPSPMGKVSEPRTLFGLVNLYNNTTQSLTEGGLNRRDPEKYRTLKRRQAQVGDSLISRLLRRGIQR